MSPSAPSRYIPVYKVREVTLTWLLCSGHKGTAFAHFYFANITTPFHRIGVILSQREDFFSQFKKKAKTSLFSCFLGDSVCENDLKLCIFEVNI